MGVAVFGFWKSLLKESIQEKTGHSAWKYTQVYWQDVPQLFTRKVYFVIRRRVWESMTNWDVAWAMERAFSMLVCLYTVNCNNPNWASCKAR